MTSTGIHMPETHGTGRHQTKVSAFLSTFIPKGEKHEQRSNETTDSGSSF